VEQMRRLANQSRKDTYNSNRDYQSLHDRRAQRFTPLVRGACRLVFSEKLAADPKGFACWGGYAKQSGQEGGKPFLYSRFDWPYEIVE
jgi:hypothetical protein